MTLTKTFFLILFVCSITLFADGLYGCALNAGGVVYLTEQGTNKPTAYFGFTDQSGTNYTAAFYLDDALGKAYLASILTAMNTGKKFSLDFSPYSIATDHGTFSKIKWIQFRND